MAVSQKTLDRLPLYLQYLKLLPDEVINVSATTIAQAMNLGDVQVRKDLGAVSGEGKPRTGYDKKRLIDTLEKFLGYQGQNQAVIVGAGRLGMALFHYPGFSEYGMHIDAAFDADITKTGETEDGRKIYHLSEFPKYCKDNHVLIGIITTPSSAAQNVCDLMVSCGIKAIWSFAPAHLTAPQGIKILSENMAASLATLWNHLNDETEGE